MLLKISWRNIWRQKRRSLIVMTSIIVGCAAVMIYDSIAMGFTIQKLNNEISSHVGHIQINLNGYNNNKVIANRISTPDDIENKISKLPYIKAYSKRIVTFGMITSAENSSGTTLVGINPEEESKVTSIHSHIIKGTYLAADSRAIVIGSAMADKLNVDVGEKIVMIAAATDGSVQSDLFRISGIYKTHSSEFDKNYIFVTLNSAQELLKMKNEVTQFAAIIDNTEKLTEYQSEISSTIDAKYEVLSYADILPLLIVYVDMAKQMMIIMYLIIGVAILFGIINTMLMSVFERIQEFGVLMSIGMKNRRIFIMILQEALLIGIIGTIVGFIVGYGLYLILAVNGLNLSAFSDSLESIGIGTVIYPVMDINIVIRALFVIPTTTVLGAVYPALKAIKLQPTEAMRYI